MSRASSAASPHARWWVVVTLVALATVLVAWRPWEVGDEASEPDAIGAAAGAVATTTPPTPGPSAPPTAKLTPPPTPDPTLTSTSNVLTTPEPPGATAVFDATTATGLFVTADQLAAGVPAASEAGVTPRAMPGWGLATGSEVVPGRCLLVRTVVGQEPVGYDARGWTGTGLTYAQSLTLLKDSAAARTAFATLVGRVDACPEYSVTDPSGDPERWQVEAAIEGQGLYPSIVQEVTVQPGIGQLRGFRGHLLVGNAVVSWTALTADDDVAGALGSADDLSAMVQDRALAAVRALG